MAGDAAIILPHVDPKSTPNRAIYIEALRRMTPEQRLAKAWELTAWTRTLCRRGLQTRHPDATDAELQTLYLKVIDRCHNQNY